MLKKTIKTAASIILSLAMICSSLSIQPTISSAAVKAKKITLNKTKLNLSVGETAKIKVKKVTPKGAGKAVKFASASKKIAKVNKNGVVTAVSEGKTKITVTSKSNKKAKKVVKVTVRDNAAQQQQSQTQQSQSQTQPFAPVNPPADNNGTGGSGSVQTTGPVHTKTPEQPNSPAVTNEPIRPDNPIITEEPVQPTKEPVITDDPMKTDKPEKTNKPLHTISPNRPVTPTPGNAVPTYPPGYIYKQRSKAVTRWFKPGTQNGHPHNGYRDSNFAIWVVGFYDNDYDSTNDDKLNKGIYGPALDEYRGKPIRVRGEFMYEGVDQKSVFLQLNYTSPVDYPIVWKWEKGASKAPNEYAEGLKMSGVNGSENVDNGTWARVDATFTIPEDAVNEDEHEELNNPYGIYLYFPNKPGGALLYRENNTFHFKNFEIKQAGSAAPDSTISPGVTPTPTSGALPTKKPTVPPADLGDIQREDYNYISDYTLGWAGGKIAVYQGGTSHQTVDEAGLKKYNVYGESDNPFEAQTDQTWDAPSLKLTQPVQYTTNDGEVHTVENLLTSFDFIADPTAIDNSEVDGKLYVYGTTEGFSYGDMSRDNPTVTAKPGDPLVRNKYQNHSLTILSTSDMVNWTDEGFMDSLNLTNLPSYEEGYFAKSGFTNGASWAPSGLKYNIDGTGNYKYYLFYTNGGDSGYVMSDSPTGPWEEPEGKAIFNKQLPNCSDCTVCFDPAVLMDDKGEGYIYFGGLSRTSGRALKIAFDPVTGRVSPEGDPVRLPTYAMFEDNEINQFNGRYYYSYCTDFGIQSLTSNASIAVYVSSDPLNVSFEPDNDKSKAFEPFTDSNGVYRHFLGTVLTNPSTIFGEGYNNHHHMQEFKGHKYILYHSTVLHNTLHRVSNQYRNLHVDEITVDPDTDAIEGLATDENGNKTIASYEGPKQVENFNPYTDFAGKEKFINATTTSNSAGVKSTRDDDMVLYSRNGSPMVLDEIDTGDWTKIQGVDFGRYGLSSVVAEVKSSTNDGAIEVFVDDPTVSSNIIAYIPVSASNGYIFTGANTSESITGVHDVYFVFRGSDYTVASWKFSTDMYDVGTLPTPIPTSLPTAKPTAEPVPTPTPEPTATPIPIPTNEPYEKDLDISSVVPVNPADAENCISYDAGTGTLIAKDLEGILVPIGEDVVPGETVEITVYGSARNASGDAQIRTWLSDSQNPFDTNYSEIQNPAEWGKTYLYTALDVASGIQIKKIAYDAANFTELVITRITVKKSWRDPKP